jgi:hypothetical protein
MANPLTWAAIIIWPLVLVWKLTLFVSLYILLPAAVVGAAGYAALLIHRRAKRALARTNDHVVPDLDNPKP